jgi:hypothetical protein
MANTIRIKRRATGDSGAPSSLENAELAFNEVDNTLYYGKGTGGAGGTATSVIAIGGDGSFVNLTGSQTISGNKTFSGTLVLGSSATATTKTAGDNSTSVATTAYVDTAVLNATYNFTLAADSGSATIVDDAETVTISGGTGLSSTIATGNNLTINLDNTTVAAGSYGSSTAVGAFTVDAQGRLTAASNTNIRTATSTDTGLASFNSTDFTVTSGAVALNAERVEDIVGAMVSSNTESGISVTYDDDGGKLNFDVNDPTITIAGDVDGSATMTNLGNTTITVTLDTVNSNVGTYGSATEIPVVTVNGKGLVTAVGTASISTSLTVGADTGTADSVALATDTLQFSGGEGIDTVVSNNTITISGEDASTSNKGIASFSSSSFDVATGAVSIKTGGVSNSQLANSTITLGSSTLTLGSTTTAIAGITQLVVDSLTIDGAEISTTASNNNISLNPHGTGTVDVNGSRITQVATPTADTDAANKAYVDSVAEGLQVKPAVRAATTGPLTATYDNGTNGIGSTLTIDGTSGLTIDGISSWSLYDGILVKNQTNAYENGRYFVSTIGNAATPTDWVLTRCGKCDEPDEIPSMYIFVQSGSTLASTGWVASVEDYPNFDVGIDDITFIQFSGAGTYTAGDGLALNGTTFSVNVALDGGIEISADALQLKSGIAGNGLTYTTGVLAVGGTADRITVGTDSVDIASTYAGQNTITTVGTIGTGTWQGTIVSPTYGGTGINNGSSTITLGGNLVTSGANALTLTTTASTNVTLPTTGTLATLAGSETLTNKTINASNIGVANPGTAAFTTLTASGATTLTAATASTSYTTGTLVVTGGVGISGALYGNSSVLSGFTIDGGTF